jgi:hypothetical protein
VRNGPTIRKGLGRTLDTSRASLSPPSAGRTIKNRNCGSDTNLGAEFLDVRAATSDYCAGVLARQQYAQIDFVHFHSLVLDLLAIVRHPLEAFYGTFQV